MVPGPVDCCTPAVLLGTGEARELERCGCADVDDINCGGQDGGRLLQGYTRWGCTLFH
jgi:syndecan 1